MSASPTVSTAPASMYGGAFWERMWRSAGIQSAGLFIVAAFLYGQQPGDGRGTGRTPRSDPTATHYDLASAVMPRLAAMFTSSTKDLAFIFSMT